MPEIQQVLLDVRYDAYKTFARDTLSAYQSLLTAAEEAGGGVLSTAALDPLIRDWWAAQPDPALTAPPGVSDPAAWIERTNTMAKAWRNLTTNDLGVPTGGSDIRDVLELGPDVFDDWDGWAQALSDGYGLPQ